MDMPRKPAVTRQDDDEDFEETPKIEKPLVYKPAEPVWHPKYDDWGFPLPQVKEIKEVEEESDK